MIMRTTCVVLLTLIFCGVGIAAEEDPKEKAAAKAAEEWLTLVDAGKYEESWTEAATYFQKAVKKKQWVESLEAVRRPLGKLKSRKVKAAVYRTTLPGAPDGQYVIVQFTTSFENKAEAIETVTPMMDSDGHWRVSGYYIK